MTITGRRITALVAVFAVVVAAIAVYLVTAGSAGMSVAAGAGTPVLTAEQIQPFTLSKAEHPDGTEYAEAPISAASFAVNQGGMVVTPQSCLGALPIVLGGAQVTGWTQMGSRPAASGRTPFQSSVGIVKGGLDLAKLREVVATCASGTISWPDNKLTAGISLSEVAAPAVKGMETFAYRSTMRFTNVTRSELGMVVACVLEPEVPEDPSVSSRPTASVSATPSPSVGATPSSSVSPAPTTSPRATPSPSGSPVLGEVAAVSKECVEHSSVPEKRTDITTEQYVAYAVVGNAYVEACAASVAEIDQLLAVPSDRLRAAGIA